MECPLIFTILFSADEIGSNVENAHAATAQGRSQLAKAAKTQRSNSSLVFPLLIQILPEHKSGSVLFCLYSMRTCMFRLLDLREYRCGRWETCHSIKVLHFASYD